LVADLSPAAFADPCGPDITSHFAVQLSATKFDRLQVPHQTVTITNNAASTKGPIYLIVDALPARVYVNNFTWTSSCEPGAFLIRVYLGPDNQFPAGATKTLDLAFADPQNVPITYNYRLVDGVNIGNPRVVPGDYDGDGYSDKVTFNPTTATWTLKYSFDNKFAKTVFGQPNDVFAVGDFDGDLKDDVAVFTPATGAWNIRRSSDGSLNESIVSGHISDIPVPGDYDEDGYGDIAVYIPSLGEFDFWQSSNHYIITRIVKPNGIPVPADCDGDGKTDPATYDPALKQFNPKVE
jgi:hypothetical protein